MYLKCNQINILYTYLQLEINRYIYVTCTSDITQSAVDRWNFVSLYEYHLVL